MKLDDRYQVRQEHTGRTGKQYVARFCGEFIGAEHEKRDAKARAQEHRQRFFDLVSPPIMPPR